MRGYLVIRVAVQRDGRDAYAYQTFPAQLGEPTIADVAHAAHKLGFEVAYAIGRYDRARWPYRLYAYTSPNRDGRGRSGSSMQCYLCAPIPCALCSYPTSLHKGRTGVDMLAKACPRCKGTCRDLQPRVSRRDVQVPAPPAD